MRFKLEETRKKLAALENSNPAGSPATTPAAQQALEAMLAARSRKSNAERLADALVVLDEKLLALQTEPLPANGLEQDKQRQAIARLEQKRRELLAEIASEN